MKTAVKAELLASAVPLEWAIIANYQFYTAQIPIETQGKEVDGGCRLYTSPNPRD